MRVFRYGTTVSTWEIVHELPGRLRLRHEELRGAAQVASYVERELETIFGVLESRASSRTGTVLIHFNEPAVSTSQLLQIVERMLHDFASGQRRGYSHPAGSALLTHSSLALAAAADFLFPLLIPASAVLLVFSNLGHIKSAWHELRKRKLGVSMLYVAIVAATIANGYFFTAAIMAWFIHFWDRRAHRELADAQHRLRVDFQRQTRFAWLCRGGAELETHVENLDRGDVVVVRTGEMIPADGVVTEGHAEVDERLVCGVRGITRKGPADPVYANSLVFDGTVKLRVTRSGETTRAASISKAIEDASTPKPAKLMDRGRPFAERAVTPTLATAGVGLALGDVGTALAILRPDYWSGPGMSEPLGNLHDVFQCAHHGIVVRDPGCFERFAQTDVLLVDLRCAAESYRSQARRGASGCHDLLHDIARGLRQLRSSSSMRIGLVSEACTSDVARCADFLGVDFHHGGLTSNAKAELVCDYNRDGRRVAFLGDCRTEALAASQSHVSISVGEIPSLEHDPADVFLLDWQLARICDLWDVSQTQKRRRRVHHSCALLPNLCCVAGAFFLGFTSLHTVLITNFGVYTVYRSGTKWLRKLQIQRQDDGNGGPQRYHGSVRSSVLAAAGNGSPAAGTHDHRSASRRRLDSIRLLSKGSGDK